ncbi:hypothetical protein Ahy_B03g062757 [Arachis hypogaea]|uniref:Uncharacterized protein n=1 Tax=Arachis hypogaea TaxID=3818 RepID=A0A444ZVD9_ARAHY|nr:hypothetical protein Ahy_B03g062757 [Arachis hypogaea]
MSRPKTEVAKSIMSSTDPTHRFVSPALGALVHSPMESFIILSMEDSSEALKMRLSSEVKIYT